MIDKCCAVECKTCKIKLHNHPKFHEYPYCTQACAEIDGKDAWGKTIVKENVDNDWEMIANSYKSKQELEAPSQSARYNQGKVQTREIDPAFILGIGEVLTKSRAKYEHYNWCKPTKLSTPYESMMRHIMAFQSGEDFDKETGSHHLLHAATNIMFMYYHCMNNPEESDDRFFKKDK